MKRIQFIALILILLLLCACVPTPEEEFVHNQSEDYMEHVQMIENVPTGTPAISEAAQPEETSILAEQVHEQVGQVAIPKEIRTEPISLSSNLLLRYDCTVRAPYDRFGIAEVEQHVFSSEELSGYLDCLMSSGSRFCELPATKAYWVAAAQSYIEACRRIGREPEEETISHITAKAESAPDSVAEKPFRMSDATEFQWYHAYTQNENGSFARFSFKLGTADFSYVKDESADYLREDALDPNVDQTILQDYQDSFPDSDTLLPKATSFLEQFGLKDMILYSATKIIAHRGNTPCEYGWDFAFVHGVNGIPQRYEMRAFDYGGVAPTLVSPFGPEAALISINQDGELMCVDFRSILTKPNVVMENVRLCEMTDIQSGVEKYMKSTFAWAAQNNAPGSCVVIDSLELFTACVNVKDRTHLGRLIPVWYVSGRYVGTTKDSSNARGETIPGASFEIPFGYYFSALDGSYIEPRITRSMAG